MEMDRRTYLGGSDAAAILGVSPWKSPLQLYQEKIGEYKEEVTPAKKKIFNRGKRLEPIVIEMMMDELQDQGHEVEITHRNNRYIDKEHPFMAAEIDAELLVNGEPVNCEIKTVNPFAAKDWGEEGTDEIPMYYTAQIAHGQMITGRDRTIVAALIGADDLRLHLVNRDNELIQIMRAKELEFWNRVINKEAPEPTSKDDINRLYRFEDADSILEADEEIAALCNELAEAKASGKNIDARIESLSTRIKSMMGDAAILMRHGQKLATWKSNKESIKVDWEKAFYALAADYAPNSFDDVANYIKSSTTKKPGARIFLLK